MLRRPIHPFQKLHRKITTGQLLAQARQAPAFGTHPKASVWAKDMPAAGWSGLRKWGAPLSFTSPQPWGQRQREGMAAGSRVHSRGPPNGFISEGCYGLKRVGGSAPAYGQLIFFKGHITTCSCIIPLTFMFSVSSLKMSYVEEGVLYLSPSTGANAWHGKHSENG